MYLKFYSPGSNHGYNIPKTPPGKQLEREKINLKWIYTRRILTIEAKVQQKNITVLNTTDRENIG